MKARSLPILIFCFASNHLTVNRNTSLLVLRFISSKNPMSTAVESSNILEGKPHFPEDHAHHDLSSSPSTDYRPREIVQNAMRKLSQSKQRMERRRNKDPQQPLFSNQKQAVPTRIVTAASELSALPEKQPLVESKPLPIPERCSQEEGIFVFMVLQDSTVVLSRPSDDASETRLFFDAQELVSADLIQRATFQQFFGEPGNNSASCQANMEFVRLTDQTGWLPVQKFVASESGAYNAIPSLRPVPVERGLWTLYVDNFPRGQYLRRHPVQSQDLNVEIMTHTHNLQVSGSDDEEDEDEFEHQQTTQAVLYQPFQKVHCHARVTHPVTGVAYYRVQGAVSGWLLDRRMPTNKDPVVRSMLLPEECVVTDQVFCFKALHNIAIRSSPTIADDCGTTESISKGTIVSVDLIRTTQIDEDDSLVNGPYLRMSDGRGWVFVNKRGTPVMEQLQCRQGRWQLKVVGANVSLLENPSTKDAYGTIITRGTVVECDRQLIHDHKDEIHTFYHVTGLSGGWIYDALNDGQCAVHVLSEQSNEQDAMDGTSLLPWNPEFVRGQAACFDLREKDLEDTFSPQRLLIFTKTASSNSQNAHALKLSSSTSSSDLSQSSKSKYLGGLTLTFFVFCDTRSISFTVDHSRKKKSYKNITYKSNGSKMKKIFSALPNQSSSEETPFAQSNHYNLAKDQILKVFREGTGLLKHLTDSKHQEKSVLQNGKQNYPGDIISSTDSAATASTLEVLSASSGSMSENVSEEDLDEMRLRHKLVDCEEQINRLQQHQRNLMKRLHEYDVMRFQLALNGKSTLPIKNNTARHDNMGPYCLPSTTPQNIIKQKTNVGYDGKQTTANEFRSEKKLNQSTLLVNSNEMRSPNTKVPKIKDANETVDRLLEAFSEIESKHEKVSSSLSRRHSTGSKCLKNESANKEMKDENDHPIKTPKMTSKIPLGNVDKEQPKNEKSKKCTRRNSFSSTSKTVRSQTMAKSPQTKRRNSLSCGTMESESGSIVEKISLGEKGSFCGDCDGCFDTREERDIHCRTAHGLYCAKCDLTFTTTWRFEKHRRDAMHASDNESSDEEEETVRHKFKNKEIEAFMKDLQDN